MKGDEEGGRRIPSDVDPAAVFCRRTVTPVCGAPRPGVRSRLSEASAGPARRATPHLTGGDAGAGPM